MGRRQACAELGAPLLVAGVDALRGQRGRAVTELGVRRRLMYVQVRPAQQTAQLNMVIVAYCNKERYLHLQTMLIFVSK